MSATHDDAILMIELAKWGSMVGVYEASREVFADDFDAEAAEITNPSVSKLLMFGETIGTLVKNGLINRELVYDWLWVEGTGQRSLPPQNGRVQRPCYPALCELRSAAAGQSLS